MSVRPFSPYLLNQLSYNFKRKNRFLDRPLRSEKRLFLFFALSIHWSDVTASKELTAKRKLWEKTYFRHVQFWFIFNLLHYLFLPTFVLFADILDDNEHVLLSTLMPSWLKVSKF